MCFLPFTQHVVDEEEMTRPSTKKTEGHWQTDLGPMHEGVQGFREGMPGTRLTMPSEGLPEGFWQGLLKGFLKAFKKA